MLGLGLVSRMPAFLRVPTVRLTTFAQNHWPTRIPVKAGRQKRTFSGQGVVVAGLFGSRTGLGRAAELVAAEFAASGNLVAKVDLARSHGLRAGTVEDGVMLPHEVAGLRSTDLIVVANPPYFMRALQAFDEKWLDRQCIVASWVWEVQTLPKVWRRSMRACDVIWVPSRFVLEAVSRHASPGGADVQLRPYEVDLEPLAPPPAARRKACRHALGLADATFCAGYSFAAASSYARKNPFGAIEIFKRAFAGLGADHVRLVLRCNDIASYPELRRRLRKEIAEDPRIAVADGSLPITDFYAAIDLYLAPLRSEGFGLNLVEASQSGIPVLATAYSLDETIIDRPGVTTVGYSLVPLQDPQGVYAGLRGAVWAEPDAARFADRLKEQRAQFLQGQATGRTGS